MRKLSKELGVSYRLFHHYFNSKEGLWRSVFDSSAGEIVAQVQREISTLLPDESNLDYLKVALNTLDRDFEIRDPNKAWMTNFTDIRTHEDWLYLTIVLNLFSRQVIGCSMKANARADLVLDALLMAIWRRKPKERVLVHSDQGIRYTCLDYENS